MQRFRSLAVPVAELLRNQTSGCKEAFCITLIAKPSIWPTMEYDLC